MTDFDEIYRNYYSQVFYYLLELSGNSHIAEEITQESFFRVLEKIDTFRGECSLKTWIIQIAKNTYFSYRKKKRTEPLNENENIADGSDFEMAISDKSAAMDIHMQLHRLADPYREVFWMRTFGELSFKEIGKIHSKTESWARVTYHRARLMLKEGYSNEI